MAGAPASSNLAAPQEYGDDESSPNAFPEDFRLDGKRLWEQTRVGDLPLGEWASVDTNASYIVNTLMAQPGRVVYLVTGPLTSLATALRVNPDIVDKIERVVWMGGAVDALGNVEELSPQAEWNVYADPEGAHRVWQLPLSIPIWMMPLDATNAVPLTTAFLSRLQSSCGESFLSRAYHSTAQVRVTGTCDFCVLSYVECRIAEDTILLVGRCDRGLVSITHVQLSLCICVCVHFCVRVCVWLNPLPQAVEAVVGTGSAPHQLQR